MLCVEHSMDILAANFVVEQCKIKFLIYNVNTLFHWSRFYLMSMLRWLC